VEEVLLSAQNEPEHRVRKAITSALGEMRSKKARAALTARTKDKSYLVSAAAARALGNFKDGDSARLLGTLLNKDSWADVIRSGALAALAESGDEKAAPTLMSWSEYGRPLRARRAAIAALAQLGEGKKVREHLTEMLHDRDPHVRAAVLSALSTLGDEKARDAIEELVSRELDGGVLTKARGVLSSLGKAGQAGLKEAKEENQRLKRDMDDLKVRLSRLEQRLEGKGRSGSASSARADQSPAKQPSAKKAVSKKPAKAKGANKATRPARKTARAKKPAPRRS
jgi:hypothetical protein